MKKCSSLHSSKVSRKFVLVVTSVLVISIVVAVSMSPNVAAYPSQPSLYGNDNSQPSSSYGNSTNSFSPNQCYGYGYCGGGYGRCYYYSCGYGNGCYYGYGYGSYNSYCGSGYNGYQTTQTATTVTQTVYSTATSYVTSYVTLPALTTTTILTSTTTVMDETTATIAGISALALAVILIFVVASLIGVRRAYDDLQQQKQIQQQPRPNQIPQFPAAGYCSTCGSPMQQGQLFCSKCGNKFTRNTQQ